MIRRLALESGLDRIEEWSAEADQTERNLVYEALFSVVEGSAFWVYLIVGDPDGGGDLLIHVRADLLLRIRLTDDDSFGVVSIEVASPAPDADLGTDRPG